MSWKPFPLPFPPPQGRTYAICPCFTSLLPLCAFLREASFLWSHRCLVGTQMRLLLIGIGTPFRKEWVLKWGGQIVIAVGQIYWTKGAEDALISGGSVALGVCVGGFWDAVDKCGGCWCRAYLCVDVDWQGRSRPGRPHHHAPHGSLRSTVVQSP